MPPPGATTAGAAQPSRFAHPSILSKLHGLFNFASDHAHQVLDFITGRLQKVPEPKGDGVMTLAHVIGDAAANEIAAANRIVFHAVGDTRRGKDSPQGDVALARSADFDGVRSAQAPAFFFHLGDVIYGRSKDELYREQFYEPYNPLNGYPGKIIALAGNHDGEVFPQSDPHTLGAFLSNFCAPTQDVPEIAGTIPRVTMNQPGVYWRLDAPFLDLIALYSNVAENPRFLSGPVPGPAQKQWLIKTLKNIRALRDQGKRKALVMATHHPPFSIAGHSGSPQMLDDIDDACHQAGLLPDLFLSGHAHNYQRYTRRLTSEGREVQIPFVVAGCGGRNDEDVPPSNGEVTGDHTYVKSRKGFGYLLVSADAATVGVTLIIVQDRQRQEFDRVQVDLATGQLLP
jgi:hypothetical protein